MRVMERSDLIALTDLLELDVSKPRLDSTHVFSQDEARRISARRSEEETDVFRERYAARSGIVSTNSGLKNRLGLGWLRVGGRGAVFRTILLKVSGWNVLRASASEKLRAMVREEIQKLLGAGWAWPFGQARAVIYSLADRFRSFQMPQNQFRIVFPSAAEFCRGPTLLKI